MFKHLLTRGFSLLMLFACAGPCLSAERSQSFDVDPQWEGHHNRSADSAEKTVTQRFGYRDTHFAGGKAAGEFGGLINPAAEPAFYAKQIPAASFDDRLSASGTLACPGETPFHVLVGFFNADTLNEWRTPNTIVIRLQGRGNRFFAFVEYATSRWRAGGDTPGGFDTVLEPGSSKRQLRGFKTDGQPHRWSIHYDPAGQAGQGTITVTIDDETAICHLDADHRRDGAKFNRFGLLNVMKQWDNPGEIWLDDVEVNGQLEAFDSDPRWDARGNEQTYRTANVRPRFDFGFSPTHFSGGRNTGELGGLVFRGDIRYPERMASYADRLERLTLDKPLKASGTIALRRAVTDSTVLLGFFNSRESLRTNPAQATGFPDSFLGLVVEGPSRAGFYVYPAYRTRGGSARSAVGVDPPTIYPDATVHRWTLEFAPRVEAGDGRITLTLDGKPAALSYAVKDQVAPTEFDRFGLITTWIDGNGQQLYFDDLTYTCSQDD